MVIVPIIADEHETQHVGQQARDPPPERLEVGAIWRSELQHHDGDDHGEHPVAEGFQAGGAYLAGWRRWGGLVLHKPLSPSLRVRALLYLVGKPRAAASSSACFMMAPPRSTRRPTSPASACGTTPVIQTSRLRPSPSATTWNTAGRWTHGRRP